MDRITAHYSLSFNHDDLQWHLNLMEDIAFPKQKCSVYASLLSKVINVKDTWIVKK